MKKIYLLMCLACLGLLKINAQCTFGNYPPTFTATSNFGANYLLGTKYNLASTSTLSGLAYAGKGTGANIQMAIYTDVSGSPGTLVATSFTSTVGTGNITISIGTPTVIPAGNYWIMAVYSGGAGTNHVDFTTASTQTVNYIALTFGTPPPNSASWITYTGQDFNYWAVVNSPVISISGVNSICSGSSATLTGSGVSTYTWNTSSNSSSISVSPTVTTTYTLIGTSNSCSVSSIKTITVSASPTITIAGVNSICNGSSATLTGSGASTYTWNTNASTSSLVVSPSVTTTYTLVGTSGICTNNATKSITVNALPTLSVNSTSSLLCLGQTASITVGGASSYTWNTASTNSVIAVSPTVTTTYSVTGLSGAGCANSISITQSVSACTDVLSQSSLNSLLYAFPNPTKDKFSIEIESDVTMEIYNTLGNVIVFEKLSSGKQSIDLSGRAAGLYFVKLSQQGNLKTIKIIKQD